MLDAKQMIKDGFKKVQVAIVVDRDRNGKEHLKVVDSLEHAKKYNINGGDIKLATMFVKI